MDVDTHDIVQAKTKKSFYELGEYLKTLSNYLREKGAIDTNLFIRSGSMFALPENHINELFTKIETCRLDNVDQRWFERRNGYSGLFFDLDIYQLNDKNTLTPQDYLNFSNILINVLKDVINVPYKDKKFTFPIFFCRRPDIEQIPLQGKTIYKNGIHVYVPTMRFNLAERKFIQQKMSEAGADEIFLEGVQVCDKKTGELLATKESMDLNAPSVPTALYGSSSKPLAKKPYELDTFYLAQFRSIGIATLNPIPIDVYKKYNLVAFMSLMFHKKIIMGNMVDDIIFDAAADYEIKMEYKSQMNILEERKTDIHAELIMDIEDDINRFCSKEPKANNLKKMLELLPIRYSDEYELWRNTIFAIADCGIDNEYYKMAERFTLRCPDKWDKRQDKLRGIWIAATNKKPGMSKITIRSLMYWLKNELPADQLNFIKESMYTEILEKFAYVFEGNINHNCVAKLLEAALRDRFVTDIIHPESSDYNWYEFVSDESDAEIGQIYKFRNEGTNPITILKFISDKLPDIYYNVMRKYEIKGQEAEDPIKAKWYANICHQLKISRNNLGNHGFKEGIIKECVGIFRRRGFMQELKNDQNVMGVGNGILVLDTLPMIIETFHEYKIRRFTKTEAAWFNPADEHIKFVFRRFFEDIIPEPDARFKILLNMASCLDGHVKDVEMLQITGSGSNGKTVLLEQFKCTLGCYAVQSDFNLIVAGAKTDANAPNSALMQLKDKRAVIYAECDRVHMVSPAMIKRQLSMGEEISGSDKHTKQETFKPVFQIFTASNWPMRTDSTDDGYWRRTCNYVAPNKFVVNPDPNNPYEKQVDFSFKTKYLDNEVINRAFLSILIKAYYVLQVKYKNSITNFKSETIMRHTEIYRNACDKINKFLSETIIIVPGDSFLTFSDICIKYIEWHKKTYNMPPAGGRGTAFSPVDMEEILENSALRKFIKTNADNEKNICGIRLRANNEDGPIEGEKWMSITNSLTNQKATPFTEEDWQAFCNEPMPPMKSRIGYNIIKTMATKKDIDVAAIMNAGEED